MFDNPVSNAIRIDYNQKTKNISINSTKSYKVTKNETGRNR